MRAVINLGILGVQTQLRCGRRFVRVRDAGEFLDLSLSGQLVKTFAVAPFAFLDRGSDVNLDEGTAMFHHFAHHPAGGRVGGNGRTDGNAAILGDLGRDIADPLDIDIAVFLGKAKFGRQVLAHHIPVQQRYRAAAHFHQLDHQRIGDGGFARA